MIRLHYFVVLLLFVSANTSCAESAHDGRTPNLGSHYMPIPKAEQGVSRPYRAGAHTDFSEVRVKIFPHNNEKYNAPAGADKVWERFSLQTSGTCTTYKAEDDTSSNPNHSPQALQSGKLLRFSASSLPYALWVKCTAPPHLVRVGYERKVIRYPGKFFIKLVRPRNRAPYLTVVNVVSEQQYLKGVVPAEMPASWEYEGLKVQAVAARTYFRYEIESNVAANDPQLLIEDSGAQLDDTVMYQAYLGVYGNAASERAIDETKNQVMTYKGQIIKAYFSADSGGHTENAENVWGVALPYCVGKPELYPHGTVTISDWRVRKTYRDIAERLLALHLIRSRKPITGISITDKYTFGRAKEITVKFNDDSLDQVSGLDFAHAMGLRSNWFSFVNVAGGVELRGRGFGHGVGMNQWGARALVAKYGKNYRQVLSHYYTDIRIETLALAR